MRILIRYKRKKRIKIAIKLNILKKVNIKKKKKKVILYVLNVKNINKVKFIFNLFYH